MTGARNPERVQTLIIGGGQAGLSVGYHLSRQGLPFLILDAHPRIGDAWRRRWESLRLFTPARYDGLAGMPFPARGDTFPTKDQMADYLETYATHFKLPIRTGVKVDKLTKRNGRFLVTAGDQSFEAEQVVVAMGSHQQPRVPRFAGELDPSIVQLHSFNYVSPSQLKDGGVLIVGLGNSGADIAIEIAKTHHTWLSGKESGHVPFHIDSFAGRFILVRIVRFIGHRVLTVDTPIGRKLRPKLQSQATPLIRVKPDDLIAAGIERVPRVTGVQGGRPLLEGGGVLDVANVIWCTGFDHGMSWIDLPVFGTDGRPMHDRGVVASEPGLYFVGLTFLYSMTSETVTGVGRDAKRTANAIASRVRGARATRSVRRSAAAAL
jgi:putative flavoprotein involved in K+ transport